MAACSDIEISIRKLDGIWWSQRGAYLGKQRLITVGSGRAFAI